MLFSKMNICAVSNKIDLSLLLILYVLLGLHFASVFGYRQFGSGYRGQGQGYHRPGQSGHGGFGHGNNWNAHGSGGGRWNSDTSSQAQSDSSCGRPTFSDAEINIENCNNNNNRGVQQVCKNSNADIPNNWKVTMLCKKGAVTFRYSSTCTSGNWEPNFYENCQQLYQQSIGEGKDNGQASSQPETPTVATGEPTLKSCLPLQVQSSKNFIYSCKFPGQAEENEGCKVSGKVVPSGTVATLKCRPPFTSQNGLFSEWNCENGHWVGESKKVLCFFSSGAGNNGQKPSDSGDSGIITDSSQPATPKPAIVEPSTKKPDVDENPSTNATLKPGEVVMCPALTHRSEGVKIGCVYGGGGTVSENYCTTPQPVGTEAKYSCMDYYEAAGGLASLFRKCRPDGRWTGSSETFSCNIECGRANQVKVAFITNGLPTVRGQWPWHAAMFLHEKKENTWSYICGGTLIGTKTILTAAHCVTLVQTTHVRPVNTLRIDFGKFKREEIDDIVQSVDVKTIHVHPSYNPYGYDSDIAVVVLSSEIKVGYHVRPICFPQTSDSPLEELQLSENSIGTTVGFGYNEKRELAVELQMARLRVIGPRECSETIKSDASGQIQTRSTTYCAGFKNGTNVCNGDSGSGMYFPSKTADQTKWYLQGLVSVGIADEDGHCDPNQLSVFTRVGRYADWIVRTLSEN